MRRHHSDFESFGLVMFVSLALAVLLTIFGFQTLAGA